MGTLFNSQGHYCISHPRYIKGAGQGNWGLDITQFPNLFKAGHLTKTIDGMNSSGNLFLIQITGMRQNNSYTSPKRAAARLPHPVTLVQGVMADSYPGNIGDGI